jgi:hypothetical protein
MKYCTSCGAALLDGFRFCVQCGATVPTAQPAIDPTVIELDTATEPEKVETPVASPSGMPEFSPEPFAFEAEEVAEQPADEPSEPVTSAPSYDASYVPSYAPTADAAPSAEVTPDEPTESAPASTPKVEKGLLSFDGAFVALLLFALPGVGLITAIIWALGGAHNPSRKNLARAYLLLVLAVCVFAVCMGLLVWALAGDQMRQFYDLLRTYLQSQAAVLPLR